VKHRQKFVHHSFARLGSDVVFVSSELLPVLKFALLILSFECAHLSRQLLELFEEPTIAFFLLDRLRSQVKMDFLQVCLYGLLNEPHHFVVVELFVED
jgi:hypothetical protein